MTTAFLAEVDTPSGTRYLGRGQRLQVLPFFFRSATQLKALLSKYTPGMSSDRYEKSRDVFKTTIVVCDNIEKGLRQSNGSMLTVAQFMEREYGSNSKYAPSAPKNAVFKLQHQNIGQAGIKRSFAGSGKWGRTWERQGDLRLHLTANIDKFRKEYYGAVVLQIEYSDDGLSILSVKKTSLVDWYIQSPTCKKRYFDLTRRSFGDTNDPFLKSDYS